MNLNNPIHQSIYQKVVVPSLNKIQGTVDGYVIQTDYKSLTCEVVYKTSNSPSWHTMKGVRLPKADDGVFTQSVSNGDKVTISFKNKSLDSPYISTVYKGDHSEKNYTSPYGGRTIRQSRIL